MTIRITGMNSGLDTESIITELASARSVKVDKIKKDQTKLSWKIDAWKELNTKIYSFYTDVLSDLRFDSAYTKKTTKVSNPNAVSVITGGNAVNSTQKLKVKETAATAYLTGAELKVGGKRATQQATLSDLGIEKDVKCNVTVGGETKMLSLSKTDTLSDVAKKFSEAGLNARFDEATGRFFISSKESGKEADFTLEPGIQELQKKLAVPEEPKQADYATAAEYQKAVDERNSIIEKNKEIDATNARIEAENAKAPEEFVKAFKSLGLVTAKQAEKLDQKYAGLNAAFTKEEIEAGKAAGKIDGQDAEIELNGIKFTSASNTFEINGLTITTLQRTGDEEVTLTTQQDTDGIYDVIKNFLKKYNELINEMDKLYNAESASKYEPLTSEEKDALSDTEVEEWEKKIKDALLRRDSTLSSVANAMKQAMMTTHLQGVEGINDGKDIYLAFFGIETLGYFKAKDNEKSAYHINGDQDDSAVKNNEEKLKKAIASNPDTVVEFFKQLSTNLYNALDEKMGRTDYSSSFTVYNDKLMDTEMKNYESKIKTEQDKLNDYIDRWYEKFSQMEVALSKLNSKESSISSLFG